MIARFDGCLAALFVAVSALGIVLIFALVFEHEA